MKADELGIGNWCNIIKSPFIEEIGEHQIEAITIHYFESGEDLILEPIPLSEEWLLKFGFVHDCATQDINFWIDMVTHYLELRDFRDEWYPTYCQLPEMPSERTQRCGMNSIKYVHQLQNLYFALTGTELTIQDKTN